LSNENKSRSNPKNEVGMSYSIWGAIDLIACFSFRKTLDFIMSNVNQNRYFPSKDSKHCLIRTYGHGRFFEK
jgi:hypothetical protein